MKLPLLRIHLLSVLGLLLCACSDDQSRVALETAASAEVMAEVDRALEVVGITSASVSAFSDRSIAVLPFTDVSENSDQAYFTDGLAIELINRLAMMPELQVTGHESSLYYKGRDETVSVMGEALQVEHILLGSVDKTDTSLIVTAQMIRADDGSTVWSRTFDRELADVFAIQHEMVEEVLLALGVTPGNLADAMPGMTRNIDAYESMLHAQALYTTFTPENALKAIELLEDAVKTDPEYGRAWLQLGAIYDESQLILSQDQALDFPAQAAMAFAQAAEQAPDMPELMLVEANRLRYAGRFLEAEKMYQRYFENYGNSVARAMEEYGHMLARTGQFNEAIAMFRRARRADPFAPRYTYQLAFHELIRGQINEVRQLADFGLGLEGGQLLFRTLEWDMAMREGDLDRAAAMIRAYFDNSNNSYDSTISRQFMEKFADILELNDFESSTDDIIAMINDPSVTPLELGYVARLVALMGQPEIALDYFFAGDGNAAVWDKVYDDMRRLPDFNRLLQEKGMVDYWRDTGNWGDFCVAAGGRDFVCK